MKKPLDLCLRFHTTPSGKRVLILTETETGRALNFQTELELKYDTENQVYLVGAEFALPVESVHREEKEPLVSSDSVQDPWDVYELEFDEDLARPYKVGF